MQNLYSELLKGFSRLPQIRDVAGADLKPAIARDVPDNLYDFVQRFAGLRVDNQPFTWEGHEYLIEPYKATRFRGHEDLEGITWVWMCGAQVGKSVAAMLLLIQLCLYFWGRYFGYFLPDRAKTEDFSDMRFKPMARSIPELRSLWGADPTSEDGATDKKSVRSIGPSRVLFSYMGGVTSTEAFPLLALVFDEVRRMDQGLVELAMERTSHSPYPAHFFLSTAGFPEADIDHFYRRTNQNRFHSHCRCSDGVLLYDVFPDCIGERLPGVTPGLRSQPKTFWICPRCHEVIDNPRHGAWRAHKPRVEKKIGYHMPQILSSMQSAAKILDAFRGAKNIGEFYRSKLGIPYLSPEEMMVRIEHLRATVNPDLKWLKEGANFSMGVDQMGGYNVVVIRYWGPKDERGLRKSRLAHLEWIVADDPWLRCHELMAQYDISVCVVDWEPNYNEAMRFVKTYPGRAFLADYTFDGSSVDEICDWMDRPKDKASQKKAGEETKNKYRVRISRFHAHEWNFMRFVNRLKEQPHEKGLVAEIPDSLGRPQPKFLCEEVYWVHLQKLAKQKEWIDEAQGKFRMTFVNVGLDPHFTHADLYAELALSRVSDKVGQAFGQFSAAERERTVEGQHDWQQLANKNHWQCSKCRIAVAVPVGATAQEIAKKGGMGVCKLNEFV